MLCSQFLFRLLTSQKNRRVLGWKCKKRHKHESLTFIVNSNGATPAATSAKSLCWGSVLWLWTVVWKQATWQLPLLCHPGNESGEVLFFSFPSAILPWVWLARSWLAGCQCGLACLACEVTFSVYFGSVLILSPQHRFSHQGKVNTAYICRLHHLLHKLPGL